MFSAKRAKLFGFEAFRVFFFILVRTVIPPPARGALKLHKFSHISLLAARKILRLTPRSWGYPNISEMTPAPTVCPPSRMANLSSFSMAMGVMSSAVIVTESPGMTISTSLGSWMTPVTSVVRK